MSRFIASTPPELRRGDTDLRILVVDDDYEHRQKITNLLRLRNDVDVVDCALPEDVRALSHKFEFAVCLFDVRWGSNSRIEELVHDAMEFWPNTKIIVLTSYPSLELGSVSSYISDVISKSCVEDEPCILIEKIVEVDHRFARSRRFKTLLQAKQPVELYRLTGQVLGVCPPYVEVVVDEPHSSGAAAKQKKLLMDYDLFAAAGVLEQFMPFVFRTYRQGSRVISEVTLDEKIAQKPLVLPPIC